MNQNQIPDEFSINKAVFVIVVNLDIISGSMKEFLKEPVARRKEFMKKIVDLY